MKKIPFFLFIVVMRIVAAIILIISYVMVKIFEFIFSPFFLLNKGMTIRRQHPAW